MTQYYSKYYKGFTLQQTSGGWIILNCPNRTAAGPISQGPYGTWMIAAHVVDQIIDADKRYNSSGSLGSSQGDDYEYVDFGRLPGKVQFIVFLIIAAYFIYSVVLK